MHLGTFGLLRTLFDIEPLRAPALLGVMLLRTFTSGVGILMLIPMLGVVGLNVHDGSVGTITRALESVFAWIGLQPTLLVVLTVYVGIMVANAGLARWQTVLASNVEQSVVTELRKRFYAAITHAKWAFLSRQRSTDYAHVLTNELERVAAAVSALLSVSVRTVMAVVYIGLAFALSPVMTALVAVAGAGLSLALRGMTMAGHTKGEAISRAYGALHAAIGEQVAGMKISKSLGLEDEQTQFFGRQAENTARARVALDRNAASLALWFESGSVVILATMLYIALEALALPLSGILILLFLFARLIPVVSGVQKGVQRFLNLIPAYGNVARELARTQAAAEFTEARAAPFDLHQGMELKGVSFAYERGESDVLRSVSLYLKAGETTAIVGPSGAGKSTLADLIIGLALPDEGMLTIDGEPLTPDRLTAWRRQVGYVPQDVFLFHESIRANLALVDPDAPDEELWDALRDAAADEFVRSLPHGLDTVVGDRGVRLSGGERQRLALARALLRRPRLLVLDEATSSLDVENEQKIQTAIDRLSGKITIVVIAHRLATVRRSDVIHVLERGTIVESGTWEQLLERRGGRFRELCRLQGIAESEDVAAPQSAPRAAAV